MSEPSGNVGPFTPEEQRRAELTVKENDMLPEGAGNPNYPGGGNDPSDAAVSEVRGLMDAARLIGEAQTILGKCDSNEAQDEVEPCEDIQARLLKAATDIEPDVKDCWVKEQAQRNASVVTMRGLDRLVRGVK